MLCDDQTTTSDVSAASQSLDSAVGNFLGANPNPGAAEVVGFLQPLADGDRIQAATSLVAQGVDAATVNAAMMQLQHHHRLLNLTTIRGVATIISAAACAFHGSRRNNGSFGWGVAWFAMGALAPVVTPVVAVAQGFGQRKVG